MYSLREYIKNPGLIWIGLANHGFFDWMKDEQYLSIKYRIIFHKKLNLDNPQTFNEKIQWLKLHDRKPEYTTMVDKYAVKEYVKDIIGEKYIIPTLGVWDRFDEIDFDSLPNQFVLKCTHDSGGLVIVREKSSFDKKAAKKKLEKCLKKNFYYIGREWPYKNVKPCIIAERYLEEKGHVVPEDNNSYDDDNLRGANRHGLSDYKFFVFNGKAKFFYITYDRAKNTGTCIDIYDMQFNKISATWGYRNSQYKFVKPDNFVEMVKLAEMLGRNMSHVRVDFYSVNRKIFFGELTFYTWSGFVPILPEEWDYKAGKLLDIKDLSG